MKKLLFTLILVIFVTACTSKEADTFSFKSPFQDECIPPLENFAYYSSGGEKPGPTPVVQLPLGNWEAVTHIPELSNTEFFGNNTARINFIQRLESGDRIWVLFEDIDKYRIPFYQIEEDRWKTNEVNELDITNDLLLFPELHLDKNEVVWMALNPTNKDMTLELSLITPLLLTFDELDQQFKNVLTLQDMSTFIPKQKIVGLSLSHFQSNSKGNLWFFIQFNSLDQTSEYQLLEYSPSTNSLKRHLQNVQLDEQNAASYIISSTDVLYLLDIQKALVLQYNLATEEISEIRIPSEVKNNGELIPSSKLFLDSEQRLWINDNGWLDLSSSDDWHIVIHSPIFIEYQHYGNGLWGRTRPFFSAETEDGRLWFSSRRGTGWVDPVTGKWCLFSSYPSNVLEDTKGNLWMVSDGKLYKNDLIK